MRIIDQQRTYLFALFAVVTIIFAWISMKFYIDDFIRSPQFKYFEIKEYILDEIESEKKKYWYFLYFFVDSIWCILLVYLIYAYWRTNRSFLVENPIYKLASFKPLMMSVALIALILDLTENSGYSLLFYMDSISGSAMKDLVRAKEIFYAGFFLIFIITFYAVEIRPRLKNLLLFLKSSWLSIVICFIIVLLLTLLEQGSTIVIHLLDNPLQLLLVLFFTFVLSTIISHYPVYVFHKILAGTGANSNWVNKFLFITYKKDGMSGSYFEKDAAFKKFRSGLGSLIYLSLAFCLQFTYQKYISPSKIVGLNAIFIFILFFAIKRYFSLLSSSKSSYEVLYHILYYASRYLVWVSFGLALVFSYMHGWYITTYYSVMTYLIFMALHIMIEPHKSKVATFNQRVHSSRLNFIFSSNKASLFNLNETLVKLIFIAFTGLGSWLIIIFSHIPKIAHTINPILLIIAYLHVTYGIIIVLLKFYCYGSFARNLGKRDKNIFVLKYSWYVIPLFFIVKFMFNFFELNNISHLDLLPKPDEKSLVSLDQFSKTIDLTKSNYYIATWGGGLRATYFNMLLMEKLKEIHGSNFLDSTVAISGVSGGILGQAYYFAVQKENGHSAQQILDDIGAYNFVTTDLAYLLGRDRLPIKKSVWLRDRSIVGAHNYWRLIKRNIKEPLSFEPYQLYWAEGFRSLSYYPIIIVNNTRTSSNYGVAMSASTHDFENIFGVAVNLSSIRDVHTLSYLQTVSSSERFPLFSATATIPEEGHFVDGGYFDNSGINSILRLYSYLESGDKETNEDKKVNKDTLIIIGNSKSNYLSWMIHNWGMYDTIEDCKPSQKIEYKLDHESDIKSIIKGVLSTDRLGQYLTNSLRNNTYKHLPNLHTISYNLPYPLRKGDYEDELGGSISPSSIKCLRTRTKMLDFQISKAIEDYNRTAKRYKRGRVNHVTWDYAYPSLSRLLSNPVVNYNKAIIGHHPYFNKK